MKEKEKEKENKIDYHKINNNYINKEDLINKLYCKDIDIENSNSNYNIQNFNNNNNNDNDYYSENNSNIIIESFDSKNKEIIENILDPSSASV
jgi:hypothetical protein